MATYSLPPQDYSGPLSKRAVQLLRELQGLKVLDNLPTLSLDDSQPVNSNAPQRNSQENIEPQLHTDSLPHVSANPEHKIGKSKSRWTKKPFSREEYLNEIRGNLLGGMLLATVGTLASLIAIVALSLVVLVPKFDDIKEKAAEIAQIPTLTISLDQQIKNQKQSLQTVQKNLDALTNYFPDPSQAQVSYAHFLALLESQKILVNTQLGGISQSPTHPHLTNEPKTQIAQATAQAITSAAGKPQEPKKLPPLTADVKPGLNFYHMEFVFEGGYVAYLMARQSLVNDIPNTIIHSESVKSAKTPGLMEIHVFMSIPFISKV